jgi:diguanylate cyclase (GGDEF)-like protein
MNDIDTVLNHASDEYRSHLTKSIFALISIVGASKHGVVHIDRQTRRYRASDGAVSLLCLAKPECSLSNLGQSIDLNNMNAVSENSDLAVFYNENGIPIRMRRLPAIGPETIFFVEDVSAVHDKEFALVEQGRDILGLFENAPYGIYRSTLDGKPLRANPAMVRMNGYKTESDLMNALQDTGREWYVDPEQRKKLVANLQRDGKVIDFVSEIRLKDSDETMWVSECAWIVRDEKSDTSLIEGTVIDATGRVLQELAMRKAAFTDSLTGLGNRAAFHVHVTELIAKQNAESGFAVFLFDLDRFKDINDVFGHARGDMLLIALAKRLAEHAPPSSFLARLGGDEFAMIVPCDVTSNEATEFAKSMIAKVEVPFKLERADHTVGTSIGYSFFPTHGTIGSDLLKAADIALYQAKNMGRGLASQYNDELAGQKRQQLLLISDLRGADKRGELELFYQSVVDATSSKIVGFEALMRWRHPQRGLVSPVEFIPAAEDAGLMIDFGSWAIDQACMHAKSIPEHLHIAVNVSAMQFYSADLPKVVAAALSKHGISPSRLELEVTESFILRNEAMTLQLLQELHQIGVRIALDDFGTGYSSLSYLQRFAFDKVKIDESFVRSMKTSTVNTAIVRAVLSIGRDLGLSVVAEGIETESERNALLQEGCPFFQGFLYSRPSPFDLVSADLQVEILRTLKAQEEEFDDEMFDPMARSA